MSVLAWILVGVFYIGTIAAAYSLFKPRKKFGGRRTKRGWKR